MGPLFYLLLAYLCGSIPFGLLLGRWIRGVDIRDEGSGNIGATNVLRVLGWRLGLTVLVLDVCKGAGPTAAAWLLTAGRLPGLPRLAEGALLSRGFPELVGIAAILGHIAPVWLGFRGGKGVATSAGVIAVLAPAGLALGLLVFALTLALTRYVSLASLLGVAALTGERLLRVGWDEAARPTTILLILTSALVFFRHRGNIARLLAGRESRLGDSPEENETDRGVA